MEHLMDAIDRRLTELGLSPISGVVNNREQCTRYISRILEDHGNKVAIPFQDTLEQYDFRVKHVLFSFGLGIVLAPFCHLEDRIQAACRREAPPSFLYVWLTVCLYHDFGYFIAPACRSAASLEALDLAHPIFDAGYCESRYSRRLYEAYYREKYARHGPDSEEVGDHGILGGCVLFDRLWEAGDPHRRPLYQDICWRIMEHNIWKREQSLPPEDPFSEIDADRFRPIGLSEPLLYLLSLVDTLEMIRAYAAFVATFVGPVDGEPIAKLMERASTSRRMLDYFVMLSDRILNDPNSPLRSSELYIPVLQAQIRSPFYDRYEKLGPEYDLNLAMQNRIGKRANDFEYTLASGRRGTLYGLKADYVLLFINNPGCPMCKMLEEQLSASALVSDMVASGRLKVLALYPDEDLDAWRSYAHLMPKGWINAYDDGCKVRDGEIYDLRAIPSMYLLDAEKKVLIKDSVSAAEIENALSGR